MFLCCLLSGAWHHRTPPRDPSCCSDLPSLCGKDTGVSLPSQFVCPPTHPIRLSIHHPSVFLICPACLTYVRSSQRTQQETSTGLITPSSSPSPQGLSLQLQPPQPPLPDSAPTPRSPMAGFSIDKMLWIRLSAVPQEPSPPFAAPLPHPPRWGREGPVSAPVSS